MKKVVFYSVLLVCGLILSQFTPALLGESYEPFAHAVKFLTMLALSFIMIHVGYEFRIDKSNLKQYGWDYVVAATAAAFPWIFVAIYFVWVLAPAGTHNQWDTWKESLLASRFAAPTSAGVLFSMLAAAGLSATWVFRKTRILAIFDDLDTVLLMIPLKMMIVGIKWQLGIIILIMAILLWIAWHFMDKIKISIRWNWVLVYSFIIAIISEIIYFSSRLVDEVVPIHIEVLLPAFVLGCVIAQPASKVANTSAESHDCILETPKEKRVSTIVSLIFMVLVGLSMPAIFGIAGSDSAVLAADKAAANAYVIENASSQNSVSPDSGIAGMGWGLIALHVFLVTLISNIGKMFPLFCYRKEAHWKERLAVAVSMFPRGEVGAGVLIISLSYGIGGPMITIAMFSLALNLLLTGVFIIIVKKLLAG